MVSLAMWDEGFGYSCHNRKYWRVWLAKEWRWLSVVLWLLWKLDRKFKDVKSKAKLRMREWRLFWCATRVSKMGSRLCQAKQVRSCLLFMDRWSEGKARFHHDLLLQCGLLCLLTEKSMVAGGVLEALTGKKKQGEILTKWWKDRLVFCPRYCYVFRIFNQANEMVLEGVSCWYAVGLWQQNSEEWCARQGRVWSVHALLLQYTMPENSHP